MLVVPGIGSACWCGAAARRARSAEGGVVLRGDRIDRRVERLAFVAPGDGARVPRGEDDAGLLGDLPHRGAEADGDVVVDGHGGDVGDRHGGAQLVGADVGETDVADEPVLAHPASVR